MIPRSTSLRAQPHALAGEFEHPLRLIEQARDAYFALGQRTAALRTTAGMLHVLGELGRYHEALDAAGGVLDEIGDRPPPDSPLAPVAALMHQNMAVCYRLSGRFDEALEANEAAGKLFRDLGMAAQAADNSNNRGNLLWELGRGTEALAAFERALSARAAAGQTQLHAQSLLNIGSARLMLGDYSSAMDCFEQARRLFNSLDQSVDRHVLLLETAIAYLTLNLYPEALEAFNEADELLRSAGVIHERIRALWGLGATQLALGHPDEAQRALSEAVELVVKSANGATPILITLLLEQAGMQAAQRKHAHAVETAG